MYQSTKTYGHDIGLSACFRQWRADSHCNLLHGYALAIKLTFETEKLDHRNWVVDFGGLKDLKAMLQGTFDHKLLVASDDPQLALLRAMQSADIAKLVELPAVGCEAFAEHIAGMVIDWMRANHLIPRVRLVSVEVREHGANSASFLPANH